LACHIGPLLILHPGYLGSPLGWLIQAWNDLLYGGSWGSIAVPVVVVLGFSLVFFGIATFFFRRRYA
jgi:ABC-type multidrug transport system permease subunit